VCFCPDTYARVFLGSITEGGISELYIWIICNFT
jgi:hypothetical protein